MHKFPRLLPAGLIYYSVANLANPSLYIKHRSGFTPVTSTYILKSNFNPSIKNG